MQPLDQHRPVTEPSGQAGAPLPGLGSAGWMSSRTFWRTRPGPIETEFACRSPVPFRPWHEMNQGEDGRGRWYQVTNNSPEEYNALWQQTVTYLRDRRGVHQLLYVYAPSLNALACDGCDPNRAYLESYPGNAWVDVMAGDGYFAGIGDETRLMNVANAVSGSLRRPQPTITRFRPCRKPDSRMACSTTSIRLLVHAVAVEHARTVRPVAQPDGIRDDLEQFGQPRSPASSSRTSRTALKRKISARSATCQGDPIRQRSCRTLRRTAMTR